MHLCGGAIEEPPVKRIDGSRLGLREQSVGAVAVASARSEHRAGEREAHLSERKGLGCLRCEQESCRPLSIGRVV